MTHNFLRIEATNLNSIFHFPRKLHSTMMNNHFEIILTITGPLGQNIAIDQMHDITCLRSISVSWSLICICTDAKRLARRQHVCNRKIRDYGYIFYGNFLYYITVNVIGVNINVAKTIDFH